MAYVEKEYKKCASYVGKLFVDHGATRGVDAWGSDVPDGKVTSFPMAVKLKEGETVAFGWIEWPDKATRDKGMEAAMSDERMSMEHMPFDGQRMIFSGFEIFSDL